VSEYGTASGSGTYSKGEYVVISVSPTSVQIDEWTKKVFVGWFYENGTLASSNDRFRIRASSDLEIRAEWVTLYRIEVASEYGEASGAGWYREGSTATISVWPLEVQAGGRTYAFKGWVDKSGSLISEAARFSYEVDGPASFAAVWEERAGYWSIADLLADYGYLIAILVLVALAAALLARRKRE